MYENYPKISIKSTLAVLFYVLLFYIVVFGIFLALTYFIVRYSFLWITGDESPIIVLSICIIFWFLYLFGLFFNYELELGIKKGRLELPNFFMIIDEIIQAVEAPIIDEVFIAPNSMIGFYDRSGFWSFFGKSKKNFVIGIAVLSQISVEELKVTLAHEFAHFSRKRGGLTVWLFRTIMALRQYHTSLEKYSFRFLIPTYYAVKLFVLLYPIVGSKFSKENEFISDKIAAQHYGVNVFEDALLKYSIESIIFENNVYRNLREFNEKNVFIKNLYETFRIFRKNEVKKGQIQKLKDALLRIKESPKFSPYPTISERIEHVRSYSLKEKENRNNAASSIFKYQKRLEKELTGYLNKIVLNIEESQKEDVAPKH